MAVLNQSFIDNRNQILGNKTNQNSQTGRVPKISTSFQQQREQLLKTKKPVQAKPVSQSPKPIQKQPVKVEPVRKTMFQQIAEAVTPGAKKALKTIAEEASKAALKIQNPALAEIYNRRKDIQNLGANIGKTLQKTPDTTAKITPGKDGKMGTAQIGPVKVPVSKIGEKVTPFLTSLPGEALRSYGRTAEKLNTSKGREELAKGAKDIVTKDIPNIARNPKDIKNYLSVLNNPAVQAGSDVSDFIPGAGVASISLKGFFKKGAKEGVEEIAKTAIKKEYEPAVKQLKGLLASHDVNLVDEFVTWVRQHGGGSSEKSMGKIDPQTLTDVRAMSNEAFGKNAMETWSNKKLADGWEYVFKRLSEGKRVPIGLEVNDVSKNFSQKTEGILSKNNPIQGTSSIQEGLPSGSSNMASSKVVYTPKAEEAINVAAKQVGDKPSVTKNVINTLQKAKTNLVEYFQNESETVRKLVGKKGAVVEDSTDPYLKATLYPGKVAEKVNQGKSEAEAIIKDMQKVSKGFKTNLKGMRQQVNDYLYYRHAPERNAALGEGAAGMTTEEARTGLSTIEGTPQAAKVKELADRVSNLNKQTLDLLKDSGVITEDLYNTLHSKYQNHVPLNRILEGSDDIGGAMAGKGFSVKSTGIKAAKGSDKQVNDILGNVISNYEQAVLRSEKNVVDQATLNFARNNKDILGNLMEVKTPRPIGKDFKGNIITESTNDPTVLQMFENGKRVWVKINDPQLATALQNVGREKVGGLLNAVGTFTRFYAGLATRFNPEFAFPNKIRDLQETAVYLASQKGMGFSGAAKTVARDTMQQNTLAVIDYLRGGKSEGARLYQELKSMGGTTGGFGLSTRKQVGLDLAKIEKLANSKTHKIADNLISYIDNFNTIFEDSTRLSVYRQGLKQGLSKERAAFLAKEASINFNRMGKGGPVINALWMFSNASIQGSAKMVRALKNPKVLGATVLAVGGSVSAVNQWNDQVDPYWRDKVSKYDRLNGLPVVLPNKDGEGVKYFTIPVSWGIKPIKVMADYAYDATSGQKFDPKDMIQTTISTILEAYNPVGGTDLVSALAPTFLDVPIEIARNQSWSGSKIRPESDPNQPEDTKYFQSLKETKTGQAAISISELLQSKSGIQVSPANIKYAFDQYVGGAGRAISKTVNTISGFAKGEGVKPSEYPILSRFYKEKSGEEVGQNTKPTSEVKNILQDQSREKLKLKEKVTPIYKKVQDLKAKGKDDQAQSIVDGLSDSEYEAYKSIRTSDKRNKTNQLKIKMQPTVLSVQKLIKAGAQSKAQEIVDNMTDDEYDAYVSAKKQLGIE